VGTVATFSDGGREKNGDVNMKAYKTYGLWPLVGWIILSPKF
jgi:hypothetical protein